MKFAVELNLAIVVVDVDKPVEVIVADICAALSEVSFRDFHCSIRGESQPGDKRY